MALLLTVDVVGAVVDERRVVAADGFHCLQIVLCLAQQNSQQRVIFWQNSIQSPSPILDLQHNLALHFLSYSVILCRMEMGHLDP